MFGSRISNISKGLGGVYTSFHATNRSRARGSKQEPGLSNLVSQPEIFTMAVKRKRSQSRRVMKKTKKPRKTSLGSKPRKRSDVSGVKKNKGSKKANKKKYKKKIKTNTDRF